MISITAPSRYRISKKIIKADTTSLFSLYGLDPKIGLNIVFVGKRKMRAIASTYKKEDVALPVLSFRYDAQSPENEQLWGEIILCYPQVVLLAAERGKKIRDMIRALVEHGIQNLLKG